MTIRKRIILGMLFLIVASICTAYFLETYQKNWIMLIAIVVSSIIFVERIRERSIELFLQKRLSRHCLSVISIILLFLATLFLPSSMEGNVPFLLQFAEYAISFICWMIGLFLQEVKAGCKK